MLPIETSKKFHIFECKEFKMTSLSLYTKLETLPSSLKEEAKNFIESLIDKTKKNKKDSDVHPKKNKREFGSLKGKITLSDDFDAPLDAFEDYM